MGKIDYNHNGIQPIGKMMETFTATLTSTVDTLIVGLQPLLGQYAAFLLGPMVGIIALTYVTKRIVGHVKNPKRVWRIVPLVYGVAYMFVLSLAKPDALPAYGGPVNQVILCLGLGLLVGAINILGYDAFFLWRNRKKHAAQ